MVELDEGGVMLALKEVNLVVKTNKKRRGAKPTEGENTSVYVTGLPTAIGDCSENHLSAFFGRAGKVFKVKLYKQAGTGALKGDALVTYMSSDEADKSCALLNKQSIRSGYPITVKRADFSQSESKKQVRIKPEIVKTFHGEGGLGINFGEAWEIEEIDEESQAEVLGLRPAIWLTHIQGKLIVGQPGEPRHALVSC
jgi:RNA recognition motif-containing protein